MFKRIVVQPAPLRSQLVDQLKRAMATGVLGPGARLNERELCEQFGVSRPSVREALRSLESEGLVKSVRHKGVVVATLSRKETQDIYATRGALEGLLVRQFVQHATEEQATRLRRILEAIDRQNRHFSIPGYIELKTEFYETLMEGADNTVAAAALRTIHARVAQLWATSLSRGGRAEQSVLEIGRLVDAIVARDEERAFDLCMAHNASALKHTLEILEDGAEGGAGEVPREKRTGPARADV